MNIDAMSKTFSSDKFFKDKNNRRIQVGDIIVCNNKNLIIGIVSRFTNSTVFCYTINDNKCGYEFRCNYPSSCSLIINELYSVDDRRNFQNMLNKTEDEVKIEKIKNEVNYIILGFRHKESRELGLYLMSITGKHMNKKVFIEEMEILQNKFKDYEIFPMNKNEQFISKWKDMTYTKVRVFKDIYSYGLTYFFCDLLINKLLDVKFKNKSYDDLTIKYSLLNEKSIKDMVSSSYYFSDFKRYFVNLDENKGYFNIPTKQNLRWNETVNYNHQMKFGIIQPSIYDWHKDKLFINENKFFRLFEFI